MQEQDIEKLYFVPFKAVQKVAKFIRNATKWEKEACHRSLLNLQDTQNRFHKLEPHSKLFMKNIFFKCVRSAIYSHNWDKLLYILTKSTIRDNRRCLYQEETNIERLKFYLKAFTILLMNHPYARAHGLLEDYMHMVLSCRTRESRQAVLKVLVTLTDTLYSKVLANRKKRLERDLDGLVEHF
ncbi:uncharacterized protein LOC125229607 [Leguminivora glycinivorella]|uniref:uncharacterized protein LOC125229607 n=1 Tax=Leguminivora glycinivorella TaxID=1035111 RepID=UPI00200C9852|nr:uncharacterized protein LOC125229607 [Leguminivora glycinivorella]